ncbi:MAG: hypothetical protein K2V38_22425 [Gemmataceae bacterium]|nr:hypothetical protein [Gemmataceae bacterium]
MELVKRFALGLGAGAAVVGLVMFGLSFAPPAGAESAAQGPSAPSALPPMPAPKDDRTSSLPSIPRTDTPPNFHPSPALQDQIPRPSLVSPPLGISTSPKPDIQPVKQETPKPAPGRTAVKFAGPAGMRVSWQLPDRSFHDRDLTAPASFNFVQAEVYRLRLSGLLKYPETKFYPTMEVPAPGDRAASYLAHNAVQVAFTEAELAIAAEGRLVVKVLYLPNQNDLTGQTVAPEEVSSVKLGANADPVATANGRGTVLAVIRLGNVDLENPDSPVLTAPGGGPEVPPMRQMTPPEPPVLRARG